MADSIVSVFIVGFCRVPLIFSQFHCGIDLSVASFLHHPSVAILSYSLCVITSLLLPIDMSVCPADAVGCQTGWDESRQVEEDKTKTKR